MSVSVRYHFGSKLRVGYSTPLYQVLIHALSDKSNKTKFKLLFSNVTEADILLREEFDALKKKHPETFDVLYVLDKPSENWKGNVIKWMLNKCLHNEIGPTGYLNTEIVKGFIAPASLKDKVKVFVCGEVLLRSLSIT